MEIKDNQFWVYYSGERKDINTEKIGKWMYFFCDKSFVAGICNKSDK
ncbi:MULTISPECIES: hypothetical protein [Gammaproteobacteria]|nr:MULTISPECIES: hypothetical protein [Vibrio]MBO0150397.1 hypothetical protein [Vibrio sp. Vb2424]MBO0222519.1 hypothetical protein [Vibrio parahaemolyticus]